MFDVLHTPLAPLVKNQTWLAGESPNETGHVNGKIIYFPFPFLNTVRHFSFVREKVKNNESGGYKPESTTET